MVLLFLLPCVWAQSFDWVTTIAGFATNINRLLKPEHIPTGFSSIRQIFLTPDSTSFRIQNGNVTASTSCTSSSGNCFNLHSSLNRVALAAVGDLCFLGNATAQADFQFEGTPQNGVFRIQSISASTYGSVSCLTPASGSLSLNASVKLRAPVDIPLDLDLKKAVAAVQSMEFDPSFVLSGVITDKNNQNWIFPALELFSSSPGQFLKDFPLASTLLEDIKNQVASVTDALQTENDAINHYVGQFVNNTLAKIPTTAKTMIEFLHSFNLNANFSLNMTANGWVISLHGETGGNWEEVNSQYIAVVNNHIAQATNYVNSLLTTRQFGNTSGSLMIPTTVWCSLDASVFVPWDLSSVSVVDKNFHCLQSAHLTPGDPFTTVSFTTSLTASLKKSLDSVTTPVFQLIPVVQHVVNASSLLFSTDLGYFEDIKLQSAMITRGLQTLADLESVLPTPSLPVVIDPNILPGMSASRLLKNLESLISKLNQATLSLLDVADAIQGYLTMFSTLNQVIVQPFLQSGIVVNIQTIQQLNTTSMTESTWSSVVPLQRMSFSLTLFGELTFRITPSSADVIYFQLSASKAVGGWTLPFSVGMHSGFPINTVVAIDIAYPQTSSFTANATLSTSFNINFNFSLVCANQNCAVTTTEEIPMVDPSEVLSNVQNALDLLPCTMGGLNFQIPTFQSQFSELSKVSEIADILSWFQYPSLDSTPTVLMKVQLDTLVASLPSQFTQLNWTGTLNDANLACLIMIDTSDPADSLNQQFALCQEPGNLSNYFRAEITTEFDSNSSQVQFLSIVTPTLGVVSNAKVTMLPLHLSIDFTLSSSPIFSSWEDFVLLLEVILGMTGGTVIPKLEQLIPPQGVIPATMARFYPNQLPVMSFPLQVAIADNTSSLLNTQFPVLSAKIQGGTVTGSFRFNFAATLSVIFNVPPPVSTLRLLTNFLDDTSTPSTWVVPYPNNTFELIIKMENRTDAGKVDTLNYQISVILPPNETLATGLNETLLAQLPPELRDLVTINASIPSSYDNTEQLSIQINGVQSDTWVLVPKILIVANSTINVLGNATAQFPTTRAAISNLGINVSFIANIQIQQLSGVVGILDVAATNIVGSVIASLSASGDAEMELFVAYSVPMCTASIFAKLETEMDLHLSVTFPVSIALLGSTVEDDVKFYIDQGPSLLSSVDAWNNWTSNLSLSVNVSTPRMKSLIQLSNMSICQWLQQIPDLTRALSQSSLPFSQTNAVSVWQSGPGKTFLNLAQTFCSNEQIMTVQFFCQTLQSMLHSNVCRAANITTTKFMLDLDFNISGSTASPLLLDLPTLFSSTSTPKARGSEFDFVMSSSFFGTVELGALFSTSGGSSTVNLTTEVPSFLFDIGVNFSGSATLDVGSVTLELSKLDVNFAFTLEGSSRFNYFDSQVYGDGLFQAAALYNGVPFCQLLMTIDDMAAFLNDGSINIHQALCGTGFIEELNRIRVTVSEYFSQFPKVCRQITSEVSDFVSTLFSEPVLGDLDLPLVSTLVGEILSAELNRLQDTKLLKDITISLSKTFSLLSSITLTEEQLNDIIFGGFIDTLCTSLGLSDCPDYYTLGSIDDPVLAWPLTLLSGGLYEVPTITVPLGSLQSSLSTNNGCSNLHQSLRLHVLIKYDSRLGLTIVPDGTNPILSGDIEFTLTNCGISGNLGFLGASLTATGGFSSSLTVDSSWQPSMNVVASIEGDADLGLQGLFGGLTNGNLKALPHWQASLGIDITWSTANTEPATALSFNSGQMCLGSTLRDMVGDVGNAIRNMIKPLESIFGNGGLLLTKVQFTELLFGRRLTLLELAEEVVQSLCSSCKLDGAVQAVQKVLSLIQQLDHLASFGGMLGCGAAETFQPFEVTTDSLQAQKISRFLDNLPEIRFQSSGDPVQDQSFQNTYSDLQMGGGIQLYLTQETMPNNIFNLILGKDFKIVGFRLPRVTMGLQVAFYTPYIWLLPPIKIFVRLSATLSVDFGEISLTTAAVRAAIKSQTPGKLLTGLSLATALNGQPFYPIRGMLRLEGGIQIDVWIAHVEASIFLQMDLRMRLPTLGPESTISFEQVAQLIKFNGFFGAFERSLIFSVGFRLSVELCIPLLFCSLCFMLVELETSFPIFSSTYTPSLYPPPTHGNSLAMSAVNNWPEATQARLFRLYSASCGTMVDYFPVDSHAPPISGCIPSTQIVGVEGLPAQAITMEILDVLQAIDTPATTLLTLNVKLQTYPGTSIQVSKAGVIPDQAYGVRVVACQTLSLLNPPSTTFGISLVDAPCPLYVEAKALTTITLNGILSTPATIAGVAAKIVSQALTSKLDITATTLSVSDIPQLTMPVQTPWIDAYGHPTESTQFGIQVVPEGRTVFAIAGSSDDSFTVPDLGQIDGNLCLEGGGGFNSLTVVLNVNNGENITLQTTNLIQHGENAPSRTLNWRNVQGRSITLQGAPNKNLKFLLMTPEADVVVKVLSQGQDGGVISQGITGCSGQAQLYFTLSGGGDQTLEISQGGSIAAFQCTIHVYGRSDYGDSITLDASNEGATYWWVFRSGTLDINDGAKTYLVINFMNIKQVNIRFGSGGNIVTIFKASPPSEFYFEFPYTQENTVTLYQSAQTVMFAGNYTLYLGPPKSDLYPVDPLSQLYGLVVVTGSAQVIANSGATTGAPSQNWILDDVCLARKESAPSEGPTSWICGLMMAAGFKTCNFACQVVYLGSTVLFDLETGDNSDSFIGFGVIASVRISMGPGSDTVEWGDGSLATIDLGVGVDKIDVFPTGALTLDFGDDQDIDTANLYVAELRPSLTGTRLAPIDDTGDAALFAHYTLYDLVSILRNNSVVSTSTMHGRMLSEGSPTAVVEINSTIPRATFNMDMVSDTLYQVVNCAIEARIVLDGRGINGPPAQRFSVVTSLPDTVASPGSVYVYGSAGLGGVMRLDLSSYQIAPSSSLSASLKQSTVDTTSGTLQVGQLFIGVQGIDFLAFDGLGKRLDLTVDGTPSNAELSLSAGNSAKVSLKGLQNNFLVAGDVQVQVESSVMGTLMAAQKMFFATAGSEVVLLNRFNHALLVDGCLTQMSESGTPQQRRITSGLFDMEVSNWLPTAPTTAFFCDGFLRNASTLELTVPIFEAQNLFSSVSVPNIRLNQGIPSLTFTLPVSGGTELSNSRVVSDDFDVQFTAPTQNYSSARIGFVNRVQSDLVIICHSSVQMVTWIIDNTLDETAAPLIQWSTSSSTSTSTSSYCAGTITDSVNYPVQKVTFQNSPPGTTTTTANSLNTQVQLPDRLLGGVQSPRQLSWVNSSLQLVDELTQQNLSINFIAPPQELKLITRVMNVSEGNSTDIILADNSSCAVTVVTELITVHIISLNFNVDWTCQSEPSLILSDGNTTIDILDDSLKGLVVYSASSSTWKIASKMSTSSFVALQPATIVAVDKFIMDLSTSRALQDPTTELQCLDVTRQCTWQGWVQTRSHQELCASTICDPIVILRGDTFVGCGASPTNDWILQTSSYSPTTDFFESKPQWARDGLTELFGFFFVASFVCCFVSSFFFLRLQVLVWWDLILITAFAQFPGSGFSVFSLTQACQEVIGRLSLNCNTLTNPSLPPMWLSIVLISASVVAAATFLISWFASRLRVKSILRRRGSGNVALLQKPDPHEGRKNSNGTELVPVRNGNKQTTEENKGEQSAAVSVEEEEKDRVRMCAVVFLGISRFFCTACMFMLPFALSMMATASAQSLRLTGMAVLLAYLVTLVDTSVNDVPPGLTWKVYCVRLLKESRVVDYTTALVFSCIVLFPLDRWRHWSVFGFGACFQLAFTVERLLAWGFWKWDSDERNSRTKSIIRAFILLFLFAGLSAGLACFARAGNPDGGALLLVWLSLMAVAQLLSLIFTYHYKILERKAFPDLKGFELRCCGEEESERVNQNPRHDPDADEARKRMEVQRLAEQRLAEQILAEQKLARRLTEQILTEDKRRAAEEKDRDDRRKKEENERDERRKKEEEERDKRRKAEDEARSRREEDTARIIMKPDVKPSNNISTEVVPEIAVPLPTTSRKSRTAEIPDERAEIIEARAEIVEAVKRRQPNMKNEEIQWAIDQLLDDGILLEFQTTLLRLKHHSRDSGREMNKVAKILEYVKSVENRLRDLANTKRAQRGLPPLNEGDPIPATEDERPKRPSLRPSFSENIKDGSTSPISPTDGRKTSTIKRPSPRPSQRDSINMDSSIEQKRASIQTFLTSTDRKEKGK